MLINVIIVAAVAAVLFLCVRSIVKGDGECSDCASGSTCTARATGKGHCEVSQGMMADVDKAFKSGTIGR